MDDVFPQPVSFCYRRSNGLVTQQTRVMSISAFLVITAILCRAYHTAGSSYRRRRSLNRAKGLLAFSLSMLDEKRVLSERLSFDICVLPSEALQIHPALPPGILATPTTKLNRPEHPPSSFSVANGPSHIHQRLTLPASPFPVPAPMTRLLSALSPWGSLPLPSCQGRSSIDEQLTGPTPHPRSLTSN